MAVQNGFCMSGNMYYQFKIPWSSMYNYRVEDVECSMFSAVYIYNLEHLLPVNASVKGTFILSNLFVLWCLVFSVHYKMQVNMREGIILLTLVSGFIYIQYNPTF